MRSIAVAMLAAVALPVFAQSDAVIINATRFPEDASRLPASVTVVSAEDIRKSAARTLPELLSEQVGLTLKDFYGNNAAATSVDLRGFGATGTQNTLILVDGRRVTDVDLSGVQWAAIPLASVERIEILRGTGAVLYGDGTTAGVINVMTRSPLQQGRRAEILGRVAGYGTVEGQVYGSFAAQSFGINAALYGYDSDGYRDNNRNEQQNTSVNLRWGAGESFVDLRLGTDRQNLRLPGSRRIQPSIGLDEYATDRRGAQTPLDWSSRDGERAGLTFGTRIGDAELNLGADWRSKSQQSYFDQAGFPISRDDRLDVSAFTPRLRVPANIGGMRHRFTVGADWHAWRYDSRRSDLPQNIARPINIVRVDQDTQGWYLQDAIDLSSSKLLTLGWREERVKYDASDVPGKSACDRRYPRAPPCSRVRKGAFASSMPTRSTRTTRPSASNSRSCDRRPRARMSWARNGAGLAPSRGSRFSAWTSRMRSTSIPSPLGSATATSRPRAVRARSWRRLHRREVPRGRAAGRAVRHRQQPEHRRQARAAGARAQAEPRTRLGGRGAHAPLGCAHRVEQADHG
jgi:iron complex outermembrane receptor protein